MGNFVPNVVRMRLVEINRDKLKVCKIGETVELTSFLNGELLTTKSYVTDTESDNAENCKIVLRPEIDVTKTFLVCIDLKKDSMELLRLH